MKTKSFMQITFALFALVLFGSLVSAAYVFPADITGNETTIERGEDVQIMFKLENTWTDNLIDIVIELPTLPIGDWTSARVGSTSFTIENDKVDLDGVVVNDGTSSDTIVLVFSSDNYAPPGDYSDEISFSGKYETSGSPVAIDNLGFTITINEDALLSLTNNGLLSETQNGTVTLTNDGNVPLNLDLTETTLFGVTFSEDEVNNLLPGTSADVEVSFPTTVNLEFGDNSVIIMAEDIPNGIEETTTFTVKETFCKAGQIGEDLTIRDISIDNMGQGKDDEWQLLDDIEIEVDVKNTGNDNINEVFVELDLFDSTGASVVSDLDFENSDEEKFDIGKIRDGDTETAKFAFRIPADFDDLGNYKLAIKAYSDDVGESELCVDTSNDLSNDFYEAIEVIEDEDNVIVVDESSIVISPAEAICGETIFVALDVYNVGGEGEEDQVKVTMKNTALGVDEEFIIRKDLDEGDKASVDFSFVIPLGIEANKRYPLEFRTFYDYRSSSDFYKETSEDTWSASFGVIECGGVVSREKIAAISAVLDSDAKAGEELVVTATITNLQSESATFIIDATAFQSWASLSDISERIIQLDSGEKKEVTFTFDVNANAEGEEGFVIEVQSDGVSETRDISVNIEGETTSKAGGFTFGGDNTYLWIIGIINVILIILIIIVAVRISSR